MRSQRPQPRQVLARNVRFLMDRQGFSEAELAKRSGVSQKTINNILNQRVGSSLERAEAIAKVFSLPLWQLTLPELPDRFDSLGDMELVFSSWLNASDDGRKLIRMVAEREAAYLVKE